MLEPSPLLSGVVNWLLTYAIHSTFVVCAVWLLVTTARWMSDSTRDALWKLALFVPLVTSAVQLGAGVDPIAGVFEVDTGLSAAESVSPEPAANDDEIAVRRHTMVTDAGSYTFVVERDPVTPAVAAAPAGDPPVWPWALVGLWALGAVFSLGRVGLGIVRLRRSLRGRTEVLEDPVLESFLALCQQAQMQGQLGRKVRLTSAPGLETPVALWRSEICLPSRALVELAPRQIHAVLAHELGHLQRRDPMWMTAVAVVEAIFFFQPLNRLARRRLQETAEFLCDDWAVRHTGSGEHLATSLARVASWQGECVATPLAPGVMRPGRPFVRRVNRLLDASRDRSASDGGPTRVALLLGLIGATVWLAPGVVEARAKQPSIEPAERVEVIAEKEERKVPEPVKVPEEPAPEDEDDDDDVAVVVVPDDCCGHQHRHRHEVDVFGGSALWFWGHVGNEVGRGELDLDFEVRVVVPDVRVDIGHPRGHGDHHFRHRSDRHRRLHERRVRHHERALERLERELEREQERMEEDLVEHLLFDAFDW